MELRITSRREALRFLADHERCAGSGGVALCTCGWVGPDWREHREAALMAWLEDQRRSLRSRLLSEEGIENP